MKIVNEENFPRGGSKPNVNKINRPKQPNLFGGVKKVKKAKLKIKKKNEKNVEQKKKQESYSNLAIGEELSYGKIQEEMIILGCIHNIRDVTLDIELPGRNFGEVKIKDISNKYQEELLKQLDDDNAEDFSTLNDLFKVGQAIPVKVINKNPNKLALTLNPQDINLNLRHSDLKNGMLIWGAISEISDHGYVVDLGISNCRATLLFKHSNKEINYRIGQPFYSIITKCNTLEATIVTLSTQPENLEHIYNDESTRLNNLIPGTKVDLKIKEVTKDGCKGDFLKFGGFIHHVYFREQFPNLGNYKEDEVISATIMYTLPQFHTSYLTLKDINQIEKPILAYSDIIISKIISITSAGLILSLNDGKYKGFVSNQRLNEYQEMKPGKRFKINSIHKCQIMNYNYIDRMYVCSFDLRKKARTNTEKFRNGQVVEGDIKEIVDEGILVSIHGNIDGFINNIHLSTSPYSKQIKRRFTVGQHVKAKIWYVDDKSIKLTIKPDLMKSKIHLSNVEDVVLNTKFYPGVVVHTTSKGALVVFYGNIRGWIPRSNIPHLDKSSMNEEAEKAFYIGQVIKCCVTNKTTDSLILSLETKKAEVIPGEINKTGKTQSNKPIESQEDLMKIKNKSSISSRDDNAAKSAAVKNVQLKNDEKDLDEGEDTINVKTPKTNKAIANKIDLNENKQKIKTKNRVKSKKDLNLEENKKSLEKSDLQPVFGGLENFFSSKENTLKKKLDDSSSEDESEDKDLKRKKKKLKPAERAEIAKEEEARLRQIENELADSNLLPQSAEQFDRILLGNPDNSEMWLRYIAFHAQATEFDRARTVAKRALERISYTSNQERLNVWLAYLNLENMYGNKESFEKAFEEAARCNDSLTIYLESIKMLCEMQKFNDMDEKIKKVRMKYKQDLKMWLTVGKVYYDCKRFADARKLKDTALVTLIDKKTHIQLIVQFAIMEFTCGEQNQGEALFETLLQADPKRVDIWCTYVDQLIKKGSTDLARNVLNRAVGQKLPYKKMRTLFKKFHKFETEYGDENSLQHIKLLLEEYSDK